MPIPKPNGGELEKDYISRCISDIASEYDSEGQAYAICKGEFDKSVNMAVEDTSQLIEPKPNEGREQYIRRCVPTIYKAGGEYDQRTATAMCADRYENSNTLLSKKLDSFSSVARKIKLYFADEPSLEDACWDGYIAIGTKDDGGREVPNCVPLKEEMEKIMMEKGINLAEEGGGSYPWDECIADQEARYGDTETATKVCGYIKSEYGS
jgi:hypothetical protein